MHPSQPRQWLSPYWLLLVLPPLFWAGNFIVGRAVRDSLPPMSLSLWRWVIALALILPFALKHLRKDWPFYTRHPWLLARLSLTGVVGFTCLTYIGLRDTSAANALLLNSCIPVLIALFGALFYRQRLHGMQNAGLLLSCAGVLVIITHGDVQALLKLSFSHGDLIVFCAMVSFAFYTLWSRSVPAEVNRIGLMAAQIAVALLALIPLWWIETSQGAVAHWDADSLMALLYLGVFPSVLGYLLFTLAVARFGAAQAALCIHLIPVFGAVLAVTFLGESLHLYHALGMAGILIGIWLALRVRSTTVRPRERRSLP
ncbi:DMT family transporter [Pseudomonas syringae]|nr:DMT family transporter [Pseudomonas syringae]MBD8575851.1 DMT family transporter [Pseudomonas syringae]MBD8792454.1 DMT family transporter [Pseudomonas syringae]MBD8802705.1 DMT family transporter [Pseudomonas syringae]MBD8813277.1 DMT family transporter [Pseudomonas syringae]